MKVHCLAVGAIALALLAGCASTQNQTAPSASATGATSDAVAENPFFGVWTTPHGAPPFDRLRTADFMPAFERALQLHTAEIAQIAGNSQPVSFANTIDAMELAGSALERVGNVFGTYASTMSDEPIRAIQRDLAPKLAQHQSDILLNPKLFARIESLVKQRDTLGLSAEQQRVLSRYELNFIRAGARLGDGQRQQIAQINNRMATLSTQFSQNLLADTAAWTLQLKTNDDLAGLPQNVRQAAAQAAKDAGVEALGLINLQRASVEAFLVHSSNRSLREQAFKAWAARGDNGNSNDNKAMINELIKLRAERAALLGYASHADFVLEDRMAKTPQKALALMQQVWEPALERAKEERAAMQAMIDAEGGKFALAGWDWRYYAEKVRQQKYQIEDADVRPYFQFEQILKAQFATAQRLLGVRFNERTDLPVWHPEVRVWEVTRADGSHVGLFYGDYFARPSKSSGAWMSSFRTQEKLSGKVTPIVLNVMNLSKGQPGQPVTVSVSDAETMFHELGHGLHGLLSDVTYPVLAGTAVATDWVEFPAQILEHYVTAPETLREFALHAETGSAMPDALIEKLRAARGFNQGFATLEFNASAFVDMDFHLLSATAAANVDPNAMEAATRKRIGMLDEIVLRHRPPHFGHIFSGGYSAGYYSYLWSEVLDADGFEAFKQAGNIYDPATAQRLLTFVYAAGNLRDPAEAYRLFRGRDPDVMALLRNRALVPSGEGEM